MYIMSYIEPNSPKCINSNKQKILMQVVSFFFIKIYHVNLSYFLLKTVDSPSLQTPPNVQTYLLSEHLGRNNAL